MGAFPKRYLEKLHHSTDSFIPERGSSGKRWCGYFISSAKSDEAAAIQTTASGSGEYGLRDEVTVL
jgi:hypothetical protein